MTPAGVQGAKPRDSARGGRLDRAEAVDVLSGIDRVEHLLLGVRADRLRQRRLHENAVDVAILVEAPTTASVSASVAVRAGARLDPHAGFLGRLELVAHVDLRRGSSPTSTIASAGAGRSARTRATRVGAVAHLLCDGFAVEDLGGDGGTLERRDADRTAVRTRSRLYEGRGSLLDRGAYRRGEIRVKDESGRDLDFVQEGKNDDADFGVIFPEPLDAGKTYKLTIEYGGGDALVDVGGGNFFLGPRSTWYPNNEGSAFGDRATFDITYHYPKDKTLIGTGAPVAPPAADGGGMMVKWSSGQTALAVAAFNYGGFKKKELLDKDTGYNLEFYANESAPSSVSFADPSLMSTQGSTSTMAMGGRMLDITQNATRLFDTYFGKLPYTRLAMTQQPAGNFGQAWPTLVYMPFTAFLDSTQRSHLGTAGNIDMRRRLLGIRRAARGRSSVVGTHHWLEELSRSVDE